jgi:hypothetical protein
LSDSNVTAAGSLILHTLPMIEDLIFYTATNEDNKAVFLQANLLAQLNRHYETTSKKKMVRRFIKLFELA